MHSFMYMYTSPILLLAAVTTIYHCLSGFFKYAKFCDDNDSLPVVPEEQILVPYMMDAVYAVAHGLHIHIDKYCSAQEFCQKAK